MIGTFVASNLLHSARHPLPIQHHHRANLMKKRCRSSLIYELHTHTHVDREVHLLPWINATA